MKKILRTLVSIVVCLPIISNYPEAVFAGGSDTPAVSGDTSTTSPVAPNSTSTTVTPTTLLQTGTNNYANVNPSTGTLNYPSCNGTCAFGIVRTSPSNGNNGNFGNQYEAVLGFIHSFTANTDQTRHKRS